MESKEIRLINLRKLLKEAKTAAWLAKTAHTSPAYISQILSNKSKGNIGDKLARKLERATGKPKGWLDSLHDENLIGKSFSQFIPLFESKEIFEWFTTREWPPIKMIRVLDHIPSRSDNVFSIEVRDDDMVSTTRVASSICPGDIAIIDQDLEPDLGNIVVINTPHAIKLRELSLDGDEQVLKALNPHYPILPFSKDLQILGVVFEVRRIFKANNDI